MDGRVQATIELIENNLKRALLIDKLARTAHLSASRLRRVFKSETGLTPAQYLKRLRIRKAKEYLETTFLSVKEIRREIGATDESHFIRDFKKVYGMPPTQLRTKVTAEESGAAGASNPGSQIGQ
ncbi:MAG TPA: helix-turn-helix transcriptional regulator [Pyrinomonadaceae bacterium]